MSRTRLPLLSLLLVVAAALCQVLPGVAERFAFYRDASLSGEFWRVLTGHLCHYNLSHFIGDVGAFLVWAAVVEWVSRKLLVGALMGTMSIVGVWLLLVPSAPLEYRGLSAVDCALAAQLFTLGCFDQRLRRHRGLFGALVAAMAIFVAKFAYEFATGHAVLAPNLGVGVRLTPEAHVIGVVVGVITAWLYASRLTRRSLTDPILGRVRHGITAEARSVYRQPNLTSRQCHQARG
jgi:rhomboid family GlyGly-CTERM serine protease